MKPATQRDEGLRRISHLTRWLAAGSVVVAGVFTAAAARALPGHAKSDPSGASSDDAGSQGGSVVPSPAPATTPGLATAPRAPRIPDGLVGPTVGGVLRSIGYDRDFASVAPSGPRLRATVRSVPGWHTIEIDRSLGTVRVRAGVALDFGATAKAWC